MALVPSPLPWPAPLIAPIPVMSMLFLEIAYPCRKSFSRYWDDTRLAGRRKRLSRLLSNLAKIEQSSLQFAVRN
jgi:hypothetical protein